MKKIILITGGNSGIGLACVKYYASKNTQIIATGRRAIDTLSHLSTEEKTLLETVDYQQMDVADEKSLLALFSHIQKTYGKLDIAINNAGIAGEMGINFHEVSIDAYHKVMTINQQAVWRCLQEEIKLMLPQKHGAIVNVSSVAGLKGSKVSALYGMSKFAVNGLTKCAALEYAQQGIRINAVCPAPIDTPLMHQHQQTETLLNNAESFIPMGRAGTSSEVANLIGWLSSDEASWMTGNLIPIDGGVTA
ncbi:MAG: short chain dehydrogenase [Legionellales bacterium]|nr:short chain dehydrogenase [Legionellales bacterium]